MASLKQVNATLASIGSFLIGVAIIGASIGLFSVTSSGGIVCMPVPASLMVPTGGCPNGSTIVIATGGGSCATGPCGWIYWVQINAPAQLSSFTINWGDGSSTTQNPAVLCTGQLCIGSGQNTYSTYHTYNIAGTFTISGTATAYGNTINLPLQYATVQSINPGSITITQVSTVTTTQAGSVTTLTTSTAYTSTQTVTTSTVNPNPPPVNSNGPTVGYLVGAVGVIFVGAAFFVRRGKSRA